MICAIFQNHPEAFCRILGRKKIGVEGSDRFHSLKETIEQDRFCWQSIPQRV
jgi:hypothetical protein